jgi:hypothetical protein
MSDIKTVLKGSDIESAWESVEWKDLNPLMPDFNLRLRTRFARAIERAVLAAATPGQVEDRRDTVAFEVRGLEMDGKVLAKKICYTDAEAKDFIKALIDNGSYRNIVTMALCYAAIAAPGSKSASVSEHKGDV